MATAYTSLLGLALPVTGDLSGTWGTTVNDEITALLDSAIAGTTSITADADITLSDTDGAGNEARQAVILWNPAAGTTTRNITAPARSKAYIVINASGGTQSIVLRGAGPTTGVTIVKGEFAVCAWNGSDFVKVANQNGIGNFTTLNATTLNATTLNATTVDTTNIEVTNLKAKDGTAAGSIADSTGVVTIASSVLTTTDINGGTIDGTAVGSSTAAAGSFTTLSATGVATFSAGTAALPAITTTGDTNTGIFFPTADTIAFAEGGVESMRIDSSGNVGIGGSSSFDISPAGTGQYPQLATWTTSGLISSAFGYYGGAVTAGPTMAFIKSRSSAIGTNTAVVSGDLTGAIVFRGADGTNYKNVASMGSAVDGTVSAGIVPGRLTFSTTDTAGTLSERMRIDSDGDVGIGTASPTSLLQTAGTSAKSAFKTPNIAEVATVSATAATGTIAYDVTTQSVLYYTTNASGNFTVNFRGSSGTSLNTIMATGESISATFLVTNGATAYYNSAVQVDGSSVTPKWQGGTAPTSGNASSIDSYTYVIIKTGSAAFTVLASQTKFA